ncbi:MAG TPA: GNAT family N-acetyltransferase [Acidimicrobiales bacterium]|nr:GNAT family N-acetyltransferase [Acidimicrobiales bacterium]
MARAFFDDPVTMYIFPKERQRIRRLETFFSQQMRRTFIKRGEAYTTADKQGGALWMPPRDSKPGPKEMAEMLPLLLLLGTRIPPTLRVLQLMEAHHPKNRHYYLGTIGTDPVWQGKGIGSALMAPVLGRCDEEGIPAYLESSKASNIPFYRRHGFEVTGELKTPDGLLTLWPMWREPEPPGSSGAT